ncbi:hypothetical protein ARMGADRAFT_1031171 [Armillaria gallica]|uniref:Uncharacterized protein n=1 Tax=Armillaria gallica TaxID=47427 RepID=A0A2H3DLE3_ARMGA|nr:hypothetical protein ARMGADRAFT_1031171 [Armillaria gallica]
MPIPSLPFPTEPRISARLLKGTSTFSLLGGYDSSGTWIDLESWRSDRASLPVVFASPRALELNEYVQADTSYGLVIQSENRREMIAAQGKHSRRRLENAIQWGKTTRPLIAIIDPWHKERQAWRRSQDVLQKRQRRLQYPGADAATIMAK